MSDRVACEPAAHLVALLADGAPKRLSAKEAKRVLATIKPRDEVWDGGGEGLVTERDA